MDAQVEHEICANCKKEIPHFNYVMHTAHCARNISLCQNCKEPFPKNQIEEHKKKCFPPIPKKLTPPPTKLEQNQYYQEQKSIQDKKIAQRKEKYIQRMERLVDSGNSLTELPKQSEVIKQNGTGTKTKDNKTKEDKPKKQVLIACKYCELELPKKDLDEHENYCGARTDICNECGEFVMFKYKQLHEDSNHGFLKLDDEPGPKPSWETNSRETRRNRPPPLFSSLLDSEFSSSNSNGFSNFLTNSSIMSNYLQSSDSASFSPNRNLLPTVSQDGEKLETSREISRRLDCKTEYIRNLLHDSANITVPLRSSGAMPRNHFNHNKGPAPQPPAARKKNPPTELVIPCEFCQLPIPHEDLIQHETGCRPDLARLRVRRRSPSPEYFIAPEPSSPEVELPCEFCADLIPASQLLRHQMTCN